MMERVLTLFCLTALLLFPAAGVLVGFGIVFVYVLLSGERRQKLHSIGFRRVANWKKLFGTSVILGMGIEFSFQIVFNPVIETITASKIDLSGFESLRGNLPNYLIWILFGWVIGGFIEEILFRGFLIPRISQFFRNALLGNWTAILLTSGIFGFSHLYQGWAGVISTGWIAILFGIIFIRSGGNLWTTILTHGFVNFTGLTLIYLDSDAFFQTLIFN